MNISRSSLQQQLFSPDEQVEDVPGAVLRDVVRDGKRVDLRLAAWVLRQSSEAACALRLHPRLERHPLLLPIPALPSALLLRPLHQQSHRVQHQLSLHRARRVGGPDREATPLAIQRRQANGGRRRKREPSEFHISASYSRLPTATCRVFDLHDLCLGQECCICLAKYSDKEEVRQLPCLHVFHLNCVDQWLRIMSACPLCKQGLEN